MALIRPTRPVRVRDLQLLAHGCWHMADGEWQMARGLLSGQEPSAIRHSPTIDRVRKPVKRPGREPGACGFDSHFGHFRLETGGTSTSPASFSLPTSYFPLPRSIPWSNGTTPVRHTGDDGSTPSGINHKRAHGPTARRQLGRLSIRVQLPVSPLIQHGRQPDTVGRTALLTRFPCSGDEGSNPSPSALGEVHSLQFSVLSFGGASD